MDAELDANGDLLSTELNWQRLAERMLRPPRRRPMLVSRELYAVFKGRTYPYPFRYLASWVEACLSGYHPSRPPVVPG